MIADIFKAITVPGVTSYLGAENLERNTTPPFIVWVPTNDSVVKGKSVTRYARLDPAPFGTRWAGVTVTFWGRYKGALAGGDTQAIADLRVVEQLANDFTYQLFTQAPGAYKVNALRWLGQDGRELVQYGRGAELDIEFQIPLVTPTAFVGRSVTIPDAAHVLMNGTLSSPGGDTTEAPSP